MENVVGILTRIYVLWQKHDTKAHDCITWLVLTPILPGLTGMQGCTSTCPETHPLVHFCRHGLRKFCQIFLTVWPLPPGAFWISCNKTYLFLYISFSPSLSPSFFLSHTHIHAHILFVNVPFEILFLPNPPLSLFLISPPRLSCPSLSLSASLNPFNPQCLSSDHGSNTYASHNQAPTPLYHLHTGYLPCVILMKIWYHSHHHRISSR